MVSRFVIYMVTEMVIYLKYVIESCIWPLICNLVGIDDGITLGTYDGLCEGETLGSSDGIELGDTDGSRDGNILEICDGIVYLTITW